MVRIAEQETRSLLNDLPPPLRERARAIPIVFERRPGPQQVEEGDDPDLMGLFVGPSMREGEAAPPEEEAHVILFLDNILDEAEGDQDTFRDEVRTTLLHELGHYLGLEESDLAERELE